MRPGPVGQACMVCSGSALGGRFSIRTPAWSSLMLMRACSRISAARPAASAAVRWYAYLHLSDADRNYRKSEISPIGLAPYLRGALGGKASARLTSHYWASSRKPSLATLRSVRSPPPTTA
jgi:hypothetical protein